MLIVLFSLRDSFRTRAVLQAEILALRHQLLVLQRSSRGRRLRLRWADRVLWVWLSRLWNDWPQHCSLSSRRLSSPGVARGFDCIGIGRVAILKDDRVSPEVRNLIRKMSLANPRWGAPRIHGELLKIKCKMCLKRIACKVLCNIVTRPRFKALWSFGE